MTARTGAVGTRVLPVVATLAAVALLAGGID